MGHNGSYLCIPKRQPGVSSRECCAFHNGNQKLAHFYHFSADALVILDVHNKTTQRTEEKARPTTSESPHSARRATVGSTIVARCAGRKQAMLTTRVMAAATPAKARGSFDSTP